MGQCNRLSKPQEIYELVKSLVKNKEHHADNYIEDEERKTAKIPSIVMFLAICKSDLDAVYLNSILNLSKRYSIERRSDYVQICKIQIREKDICKDLFSDETLHDIKTCVTPILDDILNIKSDDISNIIANYAIEPEVTLSIYGGNLIDSRRYPINKNIDIMLPIISSTYANIAIETNAPSLVHIKNIILNSHIRNNHFSNYSIIVPEINAVFRDGVVMQM